MKRIILVLTITSVFYGCSQSGQTNTSPNISQAPASNANALNNTAAMTNTNQPMQAYNGMQNVSPNAFNASNDNLKVINVTPKKDELPYGQRSAPDNSVISSGSRGKDFFEARTFKNHPTLAKVEKVTDGINTTFKVYLKNGKVLEAPADKLSNFTAMTPEGILSTVGIQPKAPNTAPDDGGKKDQKQQ